eukprot:UN26903
MSAQKPEKISYYYIYSIMKFKFQVRLLVHITI